MSADLDQSPARLSAALGIVFAGLVFVVLAVSAATVAVILGLVGAGTVTVGIYRGSRATITVGSGGLLAGIVLGGVLGAGSPVVLIATIAATLAWDASQNAITVGARLGRAAETRRVEIVHVAMTTAVAAIAAGSGYIVAQVSVGSQSPVALVALLLATVVLTVALRGRTPD